MLSGSKIVNSLLGSLCTYEHQSGDITPDIYITVDRNKAVSDDFNNLVGYRVEATILRSDVIRINNGEQFTDDKGVLWEVTEVIKETSNKWYVSILQQ